MLDGTGLRIRKERKKQTVLCAKSVFLEKNVCAAVAVMYIELVSGLELNKWHSTDILKI